MKETMPHDKSSMTFIHALAANELPSDVINTTPVAGAHSYFRSKAFISSFGCNPLVAAANALLACNQTLKKIYEFEDQEQLHSDLVHEIQAFESNAKEHNYSTETIVIARYVLCATIDESILYSKINNNSQWQRYKLISTFQNEQSADERFFLILQRLLSAPKANVDLLELIYFCLNLGYEGKYRHEQNGHQQLLLVIDNLYQQIRLVRQEPPRLPLIETQISHLTEKQLPAASVSLWTTLIKTTAATLVGISLIYGSFALIYNTISKPLKQQIVTLLQTKN